MGLPSVSGFAFLPEVWRQRIRQRKRPVQGRSQATVDALLGATLQVLVRDGYRALTTVRVAARAGVSVGTLYQYFPDKRSLVTALKVEYAELLLSRLGEVAREARGLPFEAAVRRMIEALLAAKRENLALTLSLRESMVEIGGDVILREVTLQMVGAVRELIDASTPCVRSPDVAARTVVAAVEGVVAGALSEEPELLESPAFADELVALVVGYVRTRPGAADRRRRSSTHAPSRA